MMYAYTSPLNFVLPMFAMTLKTRAQIRVEFYLHKILSWQKGQKNLV